MISKQDEKLIRFFNERGYQPVLLSRSNLIPPDLYLLAKDRYERLGSLESYLISNEKLPDPKTSNAVDFEKVETNSRSARLGVSFFSALLEKFGVGEAIEAKAKLDGAVNSVFRFKEVTIGSLSLVDIQQAIRDGIRMDLIDQSELDNKAVHIAYEYVYAGKVEISFGNHDDLAIGLESGIQKVAEINTTATSQGKDSSAVSYQRKSKPVAVAFKAGLLVRTSSGWRLRVRQSSGAGFDSRSANGSPYIYKTNEILTIKDLSDQSPVRR